MGFFFIRLSRSKFSGTSSALVLSEGSLHPDIHVCIRKAMKMATTAGTQPPWANFAKSAAKNPASMMSSGMTTAS
uniref:Uncharacterized protein n=1 Tax=Rhizobium leguminosarum TaxID=384 RepID=A0A179BR18_RHILE|nr:hypothetical protein A4U53_23855 [Rhizobium leguminosarum]